MRHSGTKFAVNLKKAVSILALGCISSLGVCNILPDADGRDDSEMIVARIKEALPAGGLISIEQNTGRLLFNPTVVKLQSMVLRQKFLLPAMVVNQINGLHVIGELPFSCFMLTAGELASENYKGYRQHETLRYIKDVKNFQVSRALICEPIGSHASNWANLLNLDGKESFVFEEHVSLTGEHFYYFVNNNGTFEMYM